MLFNYWITGVIIGILATAPLGPLAILVLQRTLNNDRWTGFFSGIGLAMSDTMYASITGFGMALLIDTIRQNELWFRIGGATILLVLGIVIFLSHPERYSIKKAKKRSMPTRHIASTFAIAVSNPYIVFYLLAIFSGFDVVLSIEKPYMAFFVLLGFLMGDLLWWFCITWLIDRYREKFSLKFLIWFNRLAGISIVLFVIIFLAHTILAEIGANSSAAISMVNLVLF